MSSPVCENVFGTMKSFTTLIKISSSFLQPSASNVNVNSSRIIRSEIQSHIAGSTAYLFMWVIDCPEISSSICKILGARTSICYKQKYKCKKAFVFS